VSEGKLEKRLIITTEIRLQVRVKDEWATINRAGNHLWITEECIKDDQDVVIENNLKKFILSLKKYWEKEKWFGNNE